MATRQEMIDKLAKEDAEILTTLQGKNADTIVRDIEEFDDETYDLRLIQEEMIEDRFNQWGEKNGYNAKSERLEIALEEYYEQMYQIMANKIDDPLRAGELALAIDQTSDELDKLNNKYQPDKQRETITQQVLRETWGADKKRYFVNQRCGMGNQELPYCIALQNQAMNEAVIDAKDLGIISVANMTGSLGWGCVNAEVKFKKAGYGKTESISNLYTLPTGDRKHCVVRKDKDGNPVIKDGDIALLHSSNGQAFHAVRLNVDENGEVTYTAGNEERNHMRISYLSKMNATIIPMQDYVEAQAKKYYQNMSNEQLATLIAERENTQPLLYAQLSAQHGESVKNPEADEKMKQFAKHMEETSKIDTEAKVTEPTQINMTQYMLAQNRGR